MRTLMALLVASVVTGASVPQGTTPPARDQGVAVAGVGSASISGVIVDTATGKPLSRAKVSATAPGVTRETLTDADGRFTFPKLPAGAYSLSATLDAFVPTRVGAKRPGKPGTPLAIAGGQQIKDIVIAMARGAVITGTVMTPSAQSAAGVTVRVLRRRFTENGLLLEAAATTQTDDRGQYRVWGLLPGSYLVSAQPKADTLTVAPSTVPVDVQPQLADGFAMSFYPGATSAGQATPVLVGAGEERSGVDVFLPLLPLGRISGVVIGANGLPQGEGRVTLFRDDDRALGLKAPYVSLTNGRFAFSGLAPGQYTLRVLASSAPSSPAGIEPGTVMYGASRVSLAGQNQSDVSITLQRGVTVSGVARLAQPGARPVESTQVEITGVDAPAGWFVATRPTTAVDAAGRFSMPDVAPGPVKLELFRPAIGAMRARSITYQGQNLLDQPLDIGLDNISDVQIVLTDQAAELSGVARNSAGQPSLDSDVILFPADRRLWTHPSLIVRHASPGADGRYTLVTIREDDLLVVALDDLDEGEWFDPLVLERAAALATRVRLGLGEKKPLDLQVRSIR